MAADPTRDIEVIVSELPAFSSALPFAAADAALYRRLKGVTPIEQPVVPSPSSCGIVPEGADPATWPFWHARLSAAARGVRAVSRFPGNVLPGPGLTQGALAYDRFRSTVASPRGFIRDAEPTFARRSVPLAKWPWKDIAQPSFREVVFDAFDPTAAPADVSADVERVRLDADGVRLVNRLWCPGRTVDVPESLLAALVDRFPEAREHPVAFAWELEEYFGHLAEGRAWNGRGHGVWNGFWLEVGLADVDRIVPTELAVGKRLLAEIETLPARGFAPLVVNEYGCDTDGTHRLLAAWLFNLFRALDPSELAVRAPGVRVARLSAKAKEWAEGRVEPHLTPRPLLVREGLRVLAEAAADDQLWEIVIAACRKARAAPAIRSLPTVFLREGSWETVVKGPYDVYPNRPPVRVDPRVYAAMRDDPSLVLPARGPYHRTDRALLPWFDVLAINRS